MNKPAKMGSVCKDVEIPSNSVFLSVPPHRNSDIVSVGRNEENKGEYSKDIPKFLPSWITKSAHKWRRNKTESNIANLQSTHGRWRGIAIAVFVVLIVVVLICGLFYLVQKVMDIPGLKTQVGRLSAEIDTMSNENNRLSRMNDQLNKNIGNLTNEVDRLETENDRMRIQSDRLAENNNEYAVQNAQLLSNVMKYDELNDQLNASNSEYREMNHWLEANIDEYDRLNSKLNGTAAMLSAQVDKLSTLRDNITSTVEESNALILELTREKDDLSWENYRLNLTVVALNGEKTDLEALTKEQKEANANLSASVLFLNETANFIDDTLESMVASLSSAIEERQKILVKEFQVLLERRTDKWRAGIEDEFFDLWVDDTTIPIGSTSYSDVLDNIQVVVLYPLCANTTDFDLFLFDHFDHLLDPSDISLRELSSGVSMYTMAIYDYYFPEKEGMGITAKEWDDADYSCANFPIEREFSWFALPD